MPVPNIDWPARDLSRRIGAGIDEQGRVTAVGIGPRPYQKPYPPLFEPFGFSEATVETAASRGLVPVAIMVDKSMLQGQIRAAQRGCASSGLSYALGHGMGVAGEIVVADTEEEAWQLGNEPSSSRGSVSMLCSDGRARISRRLRTPGRPSSNAALPAVARRIQSVASANACCTVRKSNICGYPLTAN